MTVPDVKENDGVRLTADLKADFGDRILPAGTEGVVALVHPDGAIEVDATTEDDEGIIMVTAKPGQYEIILFSVPLASASYPSSIVPFISGAFSLLDCRP